MVPTIRIDARDVRLLSRGGDGFWLEVTWAFRNDAATPAHLLIAPPGLISDADPLILDHTARETDAPVSALIRPAPEFAEIAPNGQLERAERYPLPPWNFTAGRSVIGRFGIGSTAPDPDWPKHPPWTAIMAWQTVFASRPFDIES
jgi:hypothetical protein